MQKKMDKLFKSVCNPRNPKILAIGKNYVKHVQEMGGDEPPKEPVIFTKPHSALFPCFEDKEYLYRLPNLGHEIHHEIELGLMIGKDINRGQLDINKDWYKSIGGYFLCLDLTDRSLQGHFKKEGFPWDLAKGQDNFLPITRLIMVNEVLDPHNLELELRINDKIVQKDTTGTMYYKIPQILEYLSKFITLNVGDLILTGTPHGVGPIKDGDQLVGTLTQGEKELAKLQLLIGG